ncbi:MAG: methyltransferase domain-containing protein [Actinomycetes bacterium]
MPIDVALPPLSPNGWLRWEVVHRLLPPPDRSLRVLEVGCGQGGFGARLAQSYEYLGVEPDATSSGVARRRLADAGGRGEVRHGDLSVVTPDESFDLVCAFEVIEHIEDDHSALRSWADRLRPGGSVLLSTPAWQKRFGAADEMVGHFRRYDPPVLRALLSAAGLVNVEMVHFGMPLGYVLEAGRNAAGRRRLASVPAETSASTMAERSDASGRTLQPSTSLAATAARVGTLPFRAVQRAFPNTGPGLVARARRPDSLPG